MTDSKNFAPSRLRVNDLLEQHFDTAFATPDGIKKLRELILTLAMQSKLVAQDPNDPPASELVKEIEEEKQRLIKEKKIKKPKTLPPIKPEEVPYELPQGWEWVRIRDICHDWGQKTPDAKFTYIDVGAIDNKLGTIGADTQLLDASNAPSRARKIVKPGTVIYSTVRPYLLNIAIVEKEYDPEPIASTAFAILHPYSSLSIRFIYHYLRSPAFIRYVESTQKGVAYPAINDGDFFAGLFPLPPLPEQHRIVERIDQMMARCDKLENLRKEREEKRLAVHAAAIKKLLDPSSSNLRGFVSSCETNSPFDFLARHFGELYTIKENVAELRKAILQLAVMGRLVPQEPNDPPASELLKRIETEKHRLIKEKKIKKPKTLPPIKLDEIPYELPQGWEWCYIQDISLKVTDGEHSTPVRSQSGYYLLSARNVTNEGIKLDDVDYVLEDEFVRIRKRCNPEIGDILISCSGSVGRVAVCDSDEYVMVRSAALIKHSHEQYLSTLLAYTLRSELIQNQIIAKSRTTAQSNLFLGKILELQLPLPPLAEQHRIVERIDQLMVLCDTLDQQIDAATNKQTELLNAVMAQV